MAKYITKDSPGVAGWRKVTTSAGFPRTSYPSGEMGWRLYRLGETPVKGHEGLTAAAFRMGAKIADDVQWVAPNPEAIAIARAF
jgi:hypothetical protein